jgi:hypothetical protein
MCKEESSIYSLYTINNGGLAAKTARNLKCTMTGLSTLPRIKPELRNNFQNRNKK